MTLKEIAKKLQLRLALANPKRETHQVQCGSINEGNGFLLAFVANDEPKIDHDTCHWQTRYVFLYRTDNMVNVTHAYFFDRPYDESEVDKIYLNAYYTDEDKGQNLLYSHALEHLIEGVDPVTPSADKFQ